MLDFVLMNILTFSITLLFTKFGCDVNIKSIQEEEFATRRVGSLSSCNPNWEVIASILEPSYDVLSPLNQRLDLILKSPRTTVKKGLFAVTV